MIPSEAHAKLTCRLVADQDPNTVLAGVRRHLEAHLPPGTPAFRGRGGSRYAPRGTFRPTIRPSPAPGPPWKRPTVSAPLVVRMGGTVPISALFQRHLGLATVFFSFSTADEDFHAPNEFFRVHRLHEGLEAWARYWAILSGA